MPPDQTASTYTYHTCVQQTKAEQKHPTTPPTYLQVIPLVVAKTNVLPAALPAPGEVERYQRSTERQRQRQLRQSLHSVGIVAISVFPRREARNNVVACHRAALKTIRGPADIIRLLYIRYVSLSHKNKTKQIDETELNKR